MLERILDPGQTLQYRTSAFFKFEEPDSTQPKLFGLRDAIL